MSAHPALPILGVLACEYAVFQKSHSDQGSSSEAMVIGFRGAAKSFVLWRKFEHICECVFNVKEVHSLHEFV